MRWVAAFVATWAVGCIHDELVPCGDKLCAATKICHADACVDGEAVTACEGLAETDQCTTYAIGDGECVHGHCEPSRPHCFVDRFDDGVIDPMLWRIGNSQVAVLEENGELRIPLPAGVNQFGGLISAPFDMTDGTVAARVTPGLLYGFTNVDFAFDFGVDDFLFSIGTDSLSMISDGRTPSEVRVVLPYDAVAHRHLRVRHDATARTVTFETSPDRVTWTARHMASLSDPPLTTRVILLAGGYQDPPESSVASYDEVVAEAPTCVLR